MIPSEKDRLAAEAMDLWWEFERAYTKKLKFPMEQFRAFWIATRRYAELTRSDTEINKALAGAVHELASTFGWSGKTVESNVVADIERLECLLFDGYDPYFEGDEPPGL